MNAILEVENLNKSYRDFSLTNITFSLPEGCITGFIGINSAGKTTTLRTLLGLAKKSSRSVRIFGLDMFSLDPKRKINTLSKGMKMKYALALALSHNAATLSLSYPLFCL